MELSRMNAASLADQIHITRTRVQTLYRAKSGLAAREPALSAAFDELALALEALESALAILKAQQEEGLNARAALETELQRYQDLFAHAPAGYIITSLDGTIRQASATAAELLGTTERGMLGRSLAYFTPEGQRRAAHAMFSELRSAQDPQEFEWTLRPAEGAPLPVVLRACVRRDRAGRPQELRWLIAPRPASPEQAGVGGHSDALLLQLADAGGSEQAGDPERSDQHFAVLGEASAILAVAGDAQHKLRQVVDLLVPALADGCIVDLGDGDGGHRRLVVGAPDIGAEIPQGWMQYFVDGGAKAERSGADLRATLVALAPISTIIAPIVGARHRHGSLTLIANAQARSFDQRDVQFVESLARHIARAVEQDPGAEP